MMKMKQHALNALVKANEVYQANKPKIYGIAGAIATAGTMAITVGAEGETQTVDLNSQLVSSLSSVDYNIVLTTVVALIPVVFPAVFNLTAVRKGISFVLGLFRGA